jgi:hypothetical protein
MTYQIVLLNGNNVSYRVANIATTTTHWLHEQHLLAASSLSFISCRPKATTNGKEEMSASAQFHHISHHAMATTSTQFIILYRTVAITTMRRAIAATSTFIILYHTVAIMTTITTTISIVLISYLLRHAMATATTMAVATTFVIRQPLVYPLRVA